MQQDVLARLGFDSALLPKSTVEIPRVLILDADGAAYRACSSAKTLPTALRRFCTEVLEYQFLTNSTDVRAHLTASGGFKGGRGLVQAFKPYQGNRAGKAKPALLEPLRELLGSPAAVDMGLPAEWFVCLNRYWEADDACTMDSYVLRDKGLVVSDDKDLRMTPYPYWELSLGAASTIPNRFGYIRNADKTYPIGHGTKYFWLQMLMGDTADNIRGLDRLDGRLCGQVGAMDFLSGVECENEAANKVLWAYARNGQDPLCEAQLLWMRRFQEDCAYTYLMELDLDASLRTWLKQLHAYHIAIAGSTDETED